MRVLVTGGAGYIGSHVVAALIKRGISVAVIDDLSSGFQKFVHPAATFHYGSILDGAFMDKVVERYSKLGELGIIHLAGLKYAGLSVEDPIPFYKVNVSGTINLLDTMKKYGVKYLVFSSSCSVYGNVPNGLAISEDSSLQPVSPYGRSKYFAEQALNDAQAADNLSVTSLRYFNVIGNHYQKVCDRSKLNLLPNLYRALEFNLTFPLFGNDYPTQDGTCIRDYVDVGLLAEAHILALTKLMNNEKLDFSYNLGSGAGTSTMEILSAVERVAGKKLKIHLNERRLGDPASITANIASAKRDLNWNHEVVLDDMVSAGLNAWRNFENEEIHGG